MIRIFGNVHYIFAVVLLLFIVSGEGLPDVNLSLTPNKVGTIKATSRIITGRKKTMIDSNDNIMPCKIG
jgi:hypothetical protein